MGVPSYYSVYRLCTAYKSLVDGRVYLTDPVPFTFRPYDDNHAHPVSEGDTWQTIAARYLDGLPTPCQLWRVVWEFQPEPTLDPTVPPEPGTIAYVPSRRTVQEEIFAERRRRDYEA